MDKKGTDDSVLQCAGKSLLSYAVKVVLQGVGNFLYVIFQE